MTAQCPSKEKRCKDCGDMKSLESGFYPHPMMSDGCLNSCKECRKAYEKQRRPEVREAKSA